MTRVNTTAIPTARLTSLDGLRGVAAVIVVAWHALLSTALPERVPHLLSGDVSGTGVDPGSVTWWIFDTPLRLFSVGISAVSVFFVLSGFVLCIPIFRGKALDLWDYYPRRFLRLWLPSAAAVLFAVMLVALIPQDPDNAESAWGAKFSFAKLNPTDVGESFFLLTGTNQYNNPLWSLKWELLFSLFLPIALVVGLAVRHRGWLWMAIIACAIVSGVGSAQEISALRYGPMFLAGVFAARLVAERTGASAPRQSWMMALAGITLVMTPEISRTLFDANLHTPLGRAQGMFVVFGATVLVIALTSPSAITTFFATRPVQFLGRISFGLYLVHVPIIIAGMNVAGDAVAALWVTIPLAFLAAWAFTRVVEEPAARIARAVGKRASALGRSKDHSTAEDVRNQLVSAEGNRR